MRNEGRVRENIDEETLHDLGSPDILGLQKKNSEGATGCGW